MNQIMPGLFLGSLDDSQDRRQLKQHNITHIISIIENAKPYFEEIKYLCIDEEDSSSRLHLFFAESINFIQKARKIEKGNVLVHCFAGISRSATIVIAYMMSCTDTPYETCLGLVKKERKIVKPSPSFVRQLQQYFYLDVKTVNIYIKLLFFLYIFIIYVLI